MGIIGSLGDGALALAVTICSGVISVYLLLSAFQLAHCRLNKSSSVYNNACHWMLGVGNHSPPFLLSLVSCTAFTRHRFCVLLSKNPPLPIHGGLSLMLSLDLNIPVNFLLLVRCLIWAFAFLLSLGTSCFYGQKDLTNWIPGDIFPKIVGKRSLKTNKQKKIIESLCF